MARPVVINKVETPKVCVCYSISFFVFSDIYSLDLHNTMSVVYANLL